MSAKESKREKAREVVDILEEISVLLVHDRHLSVCDTNIACRIHSSIGVSCLCVCL